MFAIVAGAIGSSCSLLNIPSDVRLRQHPVCFKLLSLQGWLEWLKGNLCPNMKKEYEEMGNYEVYVGFEEEEYDEKEYMSEYECNIIVARIMMWITYIYLIGGMLGGILCGFVAGDRCLGRKGGLLLNNVVFAFGALLMGLAKYMICHELLIPGRLFMGINAGLNSGLVPIYLTEISPTSLRGAVSFLKVWLSSIFATPKPKPNQIPNPKIPNP